MLRCQELYSEKPHVVISILVFQMRKLKYQEIKLLIQNHIVSRGAEMSNSFFLGTEDLTLSVQLGRANMGGLCSLMWWML